MSQQQIDGIKQAINEVLNNVQTIGIENLSDELRNGLTALLNTATAKLQELSIAPPEASIPQPIPDNAELIWILAGGNPNVFTEYASTFPDPGLNHLAKNPTLLNQMIQRLAKMMPQGALGEIEGIPQADINSSNIYGFQYDPQSKKLRVRFQEGGVYEYQGIPPGIYNLFSSGAIPAKTEGQNEYGSWWKGKTPSLGASMYALIKNGGFPFQKIS